MEANLQCPLDPFVMGQLEYKMNLARVQEIEKHVSSGTCHHPPLKDIVLHGALHGSTPLLLACEEGHLDSVRHIVENWGANVRAAANFYYRKEKIGGATPLFAAAFKRHVDIVRYLIDKHADVNAVASTEDDPSPLVTGITPLQVALEMRDGQSFNDVHLKRNVIARLLLKAGANPSTLDFHGNPVWSFCGVNSIIELVKYGIDLDLRDSEGDTILHHWIFLASCNISVKEQIFVDGVHLLLSRGFDLTARNNIGFTPLLSIAQLKNCDVNKPKGFRLPTLLSILDLLLERDEIDSAEKIDALELIGAQLLLALNPAKASHYWKKALDLREKEKINKIPLQSSGQVVEWVTSEQLKKVVKNSSVHWIQAMLVRLRIHASKGVEAIAALMEDIPFMLIGRNAYFKHVEKAVKAPTVAQITDFCLEILGVFLRFDPYEPMLWDYETKVKEELNNKLLMPYFSALGKGDPLLNVEPEKIKLFLQLIFAGDPNGISETFEHDYEFFWMLAGVPHMLQREDIRKYLSASARQYEGALLSEAYDCKDRKTFCFLLHLRADPDASVTEWEWPRNKLLHLAAGGIAITGELEEAQVPMEMEFTTAHLLFDYGAQPYRLNDEGKTAVDMWIEKNCGGEGMQSPAWQNRPYWCRNTVPKLSCLVAKTIHTGGIPYSRRPGDLPVELLQFLENH